MDRDTTLREKGYALYFVVTHRPGKMALTIVLSILVAILEGVSIGFLVPLIERGRSTGLNSVSDEQLVSVFRHLYQIIGLPFELNYLLAGIGIVMAFRFAAGFVVAWLSVTIQMNFIRQLQIEVFESAIAAHVGFFDEEGSDKILNTVITQAPYAGEIVEWIIRIVQQSFLSLVYVAIALYLAPVLVLVTVSVFLFLIFVIRYVLETGQKMGNRVADANERIQKITQAGIQGIRDVKLFNLNDEFKADFRAAINRYTDSTIALGRNQAAMGKSYQFLTSAVVFLLIYLSFSYSSLSLGSLGIVLFAVYRLSPMLNSINSLSYEIAAALPHLIRTRAFVENAKWRTERDQFTKERPKSVNQVIYEDVSFSYDGKAVLRDISLSVSCGEFVAFVGPSGAGKSTIVSLLSRLYDPDNGRITVDETSIKRFNLERWRSRVSVVRQNPYVFNDTLRYNLTVGNRTAPQADIERVCAIARVTDFLDDLPAGYDTVLGDDGVRLSGGQRQRVAIARALLKDSDILVLDEATSEMDASLEREIYSRIRSMEGDRTKIVIAHRLSTVTDADRIYLVENGEIVERGSHQALLEKERKYADFYSMWGS